MTDLRVDHYSPSYVLIKYHKFKDADSSAKTGSVADVTSLAPIKIYLFALLRYTDLLHFLFYRSILLPAVEAYVSYETLVENPYQ